MHTLDLIGIFAFAVSGALMAIGRDYDVVGIAILAVVTALGGGIIRDLVLGDTPPPAFTRWQYLVLALTAVAVSSVAHPWLVRLSRPLLVFVAAGLGLFSVAETEKALDYGLAPVAATLLGVTTAVGGGVLRGVPARGPLRCSAPTPSSTRCRHWPEPSSSASRRPSTPTAPHWAPETHRHLRRPRARPAAPLARSAGARTTTLGSLVHGGRTAPFLTQREKRDMTFSRARRSVLAASGGLPR